MTRKFIFDDRNPDDYETLDSERMSDALKSIDILISPNDIKSAWQAYSDSMSASWMLPSADTEEIFDIIFPYLKEVVE